MKKFVMMFFCIAAAGMIWTGCSSVDLAALAKAQRGRIMIDYVIIEPPYILEPVGDGAEKQRYSIALNGKKIVPAASTWYKYDMEQNLADFSKKLAEGSLIILNNVPTDRQSFMPPETLAKLMEILGSSKSKTEKMIEIQKIGFYYEAADIVEKNK